MRSIIVFLVLFLFLVVTAFPANSQKTNEYRAKWVATKEILQENTDVVQFFGSLTTREQDLLNSVLQENYLLGYYTEVSQNSEDAALTELLSKTKEQLRALKEGGLYQIILYRAKNATKTHLLRYVIRRHEAGTLHGGATSFLRTGKETGHPTITFSDDHYRDGLFFGKVYANINDRYWVPLDPREAFPVINPVEEEAEKHAPIKPDNVNKKEITINWSVVGKFSLVSTLLLLAATTIVVLVGACCCPCLPVFKQVRALLEY